MENQSKDLEKSNSTDNAKIILNRLTEGSSVIKNYPTHEDIVLVLGNTGAGKSTFVQYIAGDNSKLISKAVTNARGKPTGDYIIEDTNNKIGISTINSHTELPERVFDNKTNTAIYDCPGFSDTRDAEHDISGAYFIQKIANSAKAVKLVFVINYSALKTGADKLDFMLLARHATSLVKNIDKFKDGVALIATKANDDKSDDAIITTITTYLETVRDELINKEKPSLEDKNIVQFLKLLVDDQSYKQIGFIRQPKEPGPLSNITAMQNHKKSLETLLDKNIKFVMHDDPRDFGYTISADSKNYVNDLVEEVNNSISSSVDSIAEQAKKYYNDLVQQILGKINSFRDTSTINANTSDAKAFLDKFSKGSNLISKLVEELDNVSTPKELGNKINGTIAALDLNRFTNNISDSTSSILTQGEYLEFLQNFSNETLHTRQWKSSFQNVESDFLKLEKHIQSNVTDAVEQINAKIKSNIENGSDSIKGHYSTQEKTIHDINKLYDVVRLGHETFSLASQDADKSTTPKECIEQITNKVGNLVITDTNLSTAHATLSNTVKYGDYLAYLNTLSNQSSPNSPKCTEGLNDVIKYLDNSQKWYRFLTQLNDTLLECHTHQNLQNYDIANLVVVQDKNTKVSEINLKYVLKKPSYYSSSLNLQYNSMKDQILDEYKFKHLETVKNSTKHYRFENPSCAPSNVTIANNLSVDDLYNTLGFVNEFHMYEELFPKLHDQIDFLPLYQSLLNRVDKYKENPTKKLENGAKLEDHKTVLNYLYTAILSKIHSINNNLENYLVVDIKEYLNLATKHIEEYKKKLKEVKIDTSRGQYQDKINTEITKANEIIEQDILPEINKVYEEIDINISSLIEDIVNQQKEAAEEKGKLIEQQNKLAAQLPLRALLGVVKVSSQFLALAGPMGSVAAGTIGFATDIGEKTLLDKADPLLAANAKKSLDQVTSYYKSEQAFLKVNLELSKISLSRDARSKNSDDLKVIEKKIEPLKNLLNQNFVRDNVYYDEKVHTKQELQQYYKTLSEQKAELEKEQDPTKTKNKLEKDKENADFNKAQKEKTIETQLKATMYASNMLNIGEVGYYQVTRYQKSEEEIAILGNSIKQVSNRIDKLKKYEYNIYNTMMPACKEFRSSLNNTGKMLSNKTHTGIDVIKWRVQDTIKDFQLQLQEMLQGADNSGLQAKFMRCIDKLQSGMLTMSQIYDRIQDFHDKAQLANYIADLNSYAEIKTSDNELNDNIHKLELMIQSNIVVQEYMKAVSAFKQSIFPFAELYLGYFNLPQHLRLVNISGLVNDAIKQVSFIADQITKDATVVKNKPYHIFPNIRFDSTNFEKKPFFVWKHDTNKEEISKLLQGQEIIIKADITRGIQQNAIKFREVGIHFILLDKTMQAELDEQLSHFLVDMTHLGNSYYRCNNKYYIITHDIINIQHSVNKDNNTQSYSHLDETYTIIQGNAPIFSPYTIWKIKLLSKDTDNNYFNALRKYINQTIDLALEGYGKYIELGIGVCNENLERHYKVADNILQLDTNHNGENHYRGRRDTGDNNIPYDADNVTVNNIKNDISNFKDQNIDTIDNMSTEDTSSSASSIRSPINTVIYWLSNGIAQLRFFSSASLVSYEYVKDGIQSIFGASKQINNDITQDYSSNTMNIAKCNVNESLTLADFLIRCVTKVKPYNTKEESIDLLYTRAYVSNVIVKYQEMLNDLSIQNNLPAEDLEFNPLDLMSRLEKEIINGDPRKLGKILYQHTVNNNTNYDSSEIEEKINKILEHKSEQFTYNQELYTDDTSNSSTILEDMTNTIIGIAADINHTDYQSEVNMIG